ncbi:hypothetical protein K435DRAFT_938117 [Dendrothele bispora CBS 962.96]|uniref:Uncharacterized protein n=1 Tax=Dendrothele bispora (strain CBS 962.96) TaxID=1314807 RepID=A0A4S8KYD7_DENBC|nr:hypothetical protein K435DRAFT_938117 [Dendrothele bispora CBS 962.96]
MSKRLWSRCSVADCNAVSTVDANPLATIFATDFEKRGLTLVVRLFMERLEDSNVRNLWKKLVQLSLYHTLLHYNHWDEFAAFAEPAEKEGHKSGIHYLFACLDARRQWPISLFPGSASQVATTDLTNIRNLFHDKLYSLKIVQGSSQQSTFRWFESLVSPSPSDPFTKIPECTNFFQLHTQNIWICSGGNDDNAHTRIDRPWKQTVIQSMTPANHEIYGGSFKAWFQNNVNIKTRSLGEFVEKNCWRYRSENYFCHGPSIQISYISEIPEVKVEYYYI